MESAAALEKGDHQSLPNSSLVQHKSVSPQAKTWSNVLDGVCSPFDGVDKILENGAKVVRNVEDSSDPPTDTELEKDTVLKNILLPSPVS